MKIAANQPYFVPYLGYWQLINAVDTFVIADDYQYGNIGWIKRNRILINGKPSFFRLDTVGVSQNKKISELTLAEGSFEIKKRQLRIVYGHAPYYYEVKELMEKVYSCKETNLALFLENSIKEISQYLGITTPFVRSSDFDHNYDLRREYRIYDLCQRMGADTYYNAIGGMKLYSFEEFRKRGIELGFLKMEEIQYKQFNDEFVPSLSILDVMMFNTPEQVHEMLGKYTIIKELR